MRQRNYAVASTPSSASVTLYTPIAINESVALQLVTDILAEHDTGLLITIDEIHYRQIDELREFGATIQHAFRDSRNVAFAAAGLPSAVSTVLNDHVLTFLRRAERYNLGRVSLSDVEEAIREPIEANGREIDTVACAEAAQATSGYPFLIQLIGHHLVTWLAEKFGLRLKCQLKPVHTQGIPCVYVQQLCPL